MVGFEITTLLAIGYVWRRPYAPCVAQRHEVTQIPVEQVKPGMTLAIPSESGLSPRAFQVDEVAWEHKKAEGKPPIFTLTSEPLPDTGQPWVVEYPIGTPVTRVLRTYDDGT